MEPVKKNRCFGCPQPPFPFGSLYENMYKAGGGSACLKHFLLLDAAKGGIGSHFCAAARKIEGTRAVPRDCPCPNRDEREAVPVGTSPNI